VAIVDERGRLFGRVNIIDAAAGILALLMLPLAYGAYVLFRTPPVHLTAVSPAQISQGTTRIEVKAEHLRPFLQVRLGNYSTTFLLRDPSTAVVEVPADLPVGAYDVTLHDAGEELGRLPGGLTVIPRLIPVASVGTPERHPEVIVVGAFQGLEPAAAAALATQLTALVGRDEDWGRVAVVSPPEMNVQYLEPAAMLVTDRRSAVHAVLRLHCEVTAAQCLAGGVAIAPHASVPVPLGAQPISFVVDEVAPVPTDTLAVTLRASLGEPMYRLLRQRPPEDAGRRGADEVQPRVQSVASLYTTQDGAFVATVVVHVPVVKTSSGWLFKGRPLRLGEPFIVEQARYAFTGTIIGIQDVDVAKN
jgi:hypothetical protein